MIDHLKSNALHMAILAMCWSTFPAIWAHASAFSAGETYALTFPGAEVVSEYTVRLPFQLTGHLITVEANIEGERGLLILDTGAERLLLNSKHFEGGSSMGSLVNVGQTGLVEEVRRRRVDSLGWTGFRLPKLSADILDLGHIEEQKHIKLLGMLGFNVLRPFEVFIDFSLQQVTLTRTGRRGHRLDSMAILETPNDSLDFKLYRHVIVLTAIVDGSKLKFGLDTGAEINVLDNRVRRKVLDHFKLLKRSRMRGAGRRSVEVLAGMLYRVKVGHLHCGPMATLLSRMNEINDAFGTDLDGLLGHPFLSGRRVLINYRREKLYFFERYSP